VRRALRDGGFTELGNEVRTLYANGRVDEIVASVVRAAPGAERF